MGMNLFVPITKVDVARQEVWGRAAQEVPDKVDELFDYAGSKPYFETWSKSFSDATEGKSLGNIRAMHGKVAAGKAIAVNFNDAEKAIDIGTKIVDENEWNKVLEGVYTGFSIGGSYVGDKKTEKVDGKDVVRYIASPSEISLVDNPCIPTAKFFDVVKADGSVEKVAFKPAAPAIEVHGTDEQVAEFAKALNDSGLGLGDAIELVRKSAEAKKATPPAKKEEPKAPLDKGMWNVQDFASALSSIASVARSAQYDFESEGDGSAVPKNLRDWLAQGVKIFKAMAEEEAAELIAELNAQAGETVLEMAVRLGALKKRLADPELPLVDLMKIAEENLTADERKPLKTPDDVRKAVLTKAGARHSKVDAAHLQEAHDHLQAMGATCGGDSEKKAPAGELEKVATLEGSLQAALERIKKLEQQPMPHPLVGLRVVKREEDGLQSLAQQVPADLSDIKLEPADYVKNADGSIDYAASRIQKAHKLASGASKA